MKAAVLLMVVAVAVADVRFPVPPLGLDLYMPVPAANPLTPAKVDRGRKLFNDTRLSRDGSRSCTSCHDPDRAFAAASAVSIGVFGRPGRRNAPGLVNRG